MRLSDHRAKKPSPERIAAFAKPKNSDARASGEAWHHCTGAQEHRSTDAQEHRSTGAQEHRSTGASVV